jgi:two-component system sensor histidine kinase KdpD
MAGAGDPERGGLRVYLGAAPGVGKTYAMLGDGRRLAEAGDDVVVGYVEPHGRPATRDQAMGLEVVPPRTVTYRGASFPEVDTHAIRRRRPQVALIDEFAHTNTPGSRNRHRWQDVEELRTFGVTVHTTLNLANVESLHDLVTEITGARPVEKVPDSVVRQAKVVFVDLASHLLRARVARGEVYAASSAATALEGYFSPPNLEALRDLALLWLDDRLDGNLEDFRARYGLTAPLGICAPVVVGVAGTSRDEQVIRHAAAVARSGQAELVGVHVRVSDGLAGPSPDRLEPSRRLVAELGGRVVEVNGTEVATELVRQARTLGAAQLVVSAGRGGRWTRLFGTSVARTATEQAPDLDVHAVPTDV